MAGHSLIALTSTYGVGRLAQDGHAYRITRLEDRSLYERIRLGARQTIERRFSIEQMKDTIRQLLGAAAPLG